MSADAFDSLRKLSLRILDDMALVQYAIVPVHILETGDVVANNLIRGNDNVVLLQLRQELAPLSRIPGVHDRLEVVSVFEDLVVPVTSERRWTNNQRRKVNGVGGFRLLVLLGSFEMFTGEYADRLQRLAETHVYQIGEWRTNLSR